VLREKAQALVCRTRGGRSLFRSRAGIEPVGCRDRRTLLLSNEFSIARTAWSMAVCDDDVTAISSERAPCPDSNQIGINNTDYRPIMLGEYVISCNYRKTCFLQVYGELIDLKSKMLAEYLRQYRVKFAR
jgi:hypothetical protein